MLSQMRKLEGGGPGGGGGQRLEPDEISRGASEN